MSTKTTPSNPDWTWAVEESVRSRSDRANDDETDIGNLGHAAKIVAVSLMVAATTYTPANAQAWLEPLLPVLRYGPQIVGSAYNGGWNRTYDQLNRIQPWPQTNSYYRPPTNNYYPPPMSFQYRQYAPSYPNFGPVRRRR